MTPPEIPILRVAGSRREVGRQIGEAYAEEICRNVDSSFDDLPTGRSREEQLTLAAEYRAVTERQLPWLVEELDGCAQAAGVDPLPFFAASIEEIWYLPRERVTQGRCSDLVAGPRATAKGHLLVGHNNDLSPSAEDHIIAIERSVPGDPVTFQLGGAPWLSVSWNVTGSPGTVRSIATMCSSAVGERSLLWPTRRCPFAVARGPATRSLHRPCVTRSRGRYQISSMDAAKKGRASTPAASAHPSSSSTSHGSCRWVTARYSAASVSCSSRDRPIGRSSKELSTLRRICSAYASPIWRPTSRRDPATRRTGISGGVMAPMVSPGAHAHRPPRPRTP